ncbi:MAG TPA: amidohydrolase [Candidatus Thermoplasmatota archaeon]|nr:amidohydrolase [Candidatus Thermoplasmatota archaeon]
MSTLLLKGGTVLTQDDERRVLGNADVLVEGDRIVSVGKAKPSLKAKTTIDAKGMLVLPGLVNAHTHAAMALLRGYADDLALKEWLETRIWPAEAKLAAADVRAGTDLAMLEMIAGGTTAFNDMYFFTNEIAQSARDANVRAVVGFPFLDFPTPEAKPDEMPSLARAFLARWKGDPLVTPAVAPHATYTCAPPTLARVAELAREHEAPLHVHCAETRTEVYDVERRHGARPVALLEKAGCLGPKTVLAHCGYVTKEEVRTIAASGAAVAHCPVSNLKLATGGVAPVPELLAEGASVALGTDGPASNNTLDMFETMKLAALLHKQHRWDPTVLPAQTAFDLATRHGAKALGLQAGSIEPGKLADLVVLDPSSPRMRPLHDPVSQVVYAARSTDVRTVVIGGAVVMRDRKFATLKPEGVIKAAEKAAARIVGAS